MSPQTRKAEIPAARPSAKTNPPKLSAGRVAFAALDTKHDDTSSWKGGGPTATRYPRQLVPRPSSIPTKVIGEWKIFLRLPDRLESAEFFAELSSFEDRVTAANIAL
jgi:hypothetical protein